MNLEKILRTDFSLEARHKQETLDGLLETIENGSQIQKHERMNKTVNKRKIAVAVAACLTLILSITAFAYGGEIFRVIKEITVGDHAKYMVVEDVYPISLPEDLVGKLFDENGNMLTVLLDDSPVYTESGELYAEATTATEAEAQIIDEKMFTRTFSKEEAGQHIMFDFKTPGYLPEGYEQITYKMFNGKDGRPSPDCKYLEVEYKNEDGDVIYCQMRYMDEETAFDAGSDNDIDKMDINGYEAAVSESGVDIEIDGIMYMFANHTVGSDELVKIASSIQ